MYFDQVIGQEKLIHRLTNLWDQGTLPHSLLLYGERGMGKLNLAIGLASYMLRRQVLSPDGGTTFLADIDRRREEAKESAKSREVGLPIYIDRGDVFWLRPMKQSLRIDQWYTLLEDYLSQASDGLRIVIIEGFETANEVFANAILKTIEEPPAGVYFIITTTQISRVLPTILSRCMTEGFAPVSAKQLKEYILGKMVSGNSHDNASSSNNLSQASNGPANVPGQASSHIDTPGASGDIDSIVAAASGNPSRALALMGEGLPMADLAVELFTILPERMFFTKMVVALEGKSREDLMSLCHFISYVTRDILALRMGARVDQLQLPHYRDRLDKLLDSWSTRALIKAERLSLDALDALRLYVKPALVVDGLALSLRRAVKEE